MDKGQITVHLGTKLKRELKAKAALEGTTMKAIITKLLQIALTEEIPSVREPGK